MIHILATGEDDSEQRPDSKYGKAVSESVTAIIPNSNIGFYDSSRPPSTCRLASHSHY
jgi:hypothetical protein